MSSKRWMPAISFFVVSALVAGFGDVSVRAAEQTTLSESPTASDTTATRLTSDRNPAVVGQAVTFTATVDPSTATGTVAFVDGGVDIGAVELSAGVAPFTTSSLSEGTHTITARYSGDAINAASASPPLTQNIIKTGTGALGGMEATLVSGSVLIKIPGAESFVMLGATEARQIPAGSLVDTSNGRVRITAAPPDGELQRGEFSMGIFQVLQSRKSGLITLLLTGGNFAECADGQSGTKTAVIRQLGASVMGRFRTRGRFAAATVRGTTWLTTDRCDGTLTTVQEGEVEVRDLRKHKTFNVTAGEDHLARRRGPRGRRGAAGPR